MSSCANFNTAAALCRRRKKETIKAWEQPTDSINMSRYPHYDTPEGIARRWAEGRGTGTKADYKPWFTRFDVPSIGERRESYFRIADRGIHTLSKLEFRIALFAKSQPRVTDLLEQFPMPLEETLEIASQLGIKHPRSPRTKHLVVMTTDLVLVKGTDSPRVAWTTKYVDELRSWRTLEKLEIARVWHLLHKDEWQIQGDGTVSGNHISNLEWLHPLERRDAMFGYPEGTVDRVADILHPLVLRRSDIIWRLAEQADRILGFNRPISLRVCRFLLATGCWQTDLISWRRSEEPLTLI